MDEKIIDMQVVHRSLDGNGFRIYVTYEKWAPEETGMILNKLYISQFEYLLNEGIIKIKEE